MKDLMLDIDTHDLLLTDGDLGLVDGVDAVRQHLKIRLLFVHSEWFLDGTQGIRVYDFIAIKNPNIDIVDGIIKATIQETPKVIDIAEYSSEYDAAQRKFSVNFLARTADGDVTLNTGVL